MLDAVFPELCIACETWIAGGGRRLCDRCADALDRFAALPCCPRCARTMAPASIHEDGCARCLHEHFWNVARIVRVGPYEPPLRHVIVGLKFTGQQRHAALLGNRLGDTLCREPWLSSVEAIVPVPMHRLRRAQRPCDHALDLAQTVSRRIRIKSGQRIPVQRSAVWRKKYAISQTRAVSRNQRFENVRDCFEPSRRPNVAGKTVLIVDNLLVTGATICEVSKVLRREGAKRIYAAVVARSVLPGDFQAGAQALEGQFGVPD
jgi:ComF family protein